MDRFSYLLAPSPPQILFPCRPNPSSLYRRTIPRPTTLSLPSPPPSHRLTLSLSRPQTKVFACSSPSPPPIPTQTRPSATQCPLTGLTRTLTTLLAVPITFFHLLGSKIPCLTTKLGAVFPRPEAVGPLFFAAISEGGPRSTGTPIAVILGGLAKWLEIYSCVLLIRVLLSWFPNINWDWQPMSAIRDLCDPYLSLFRGIIPPLFNSLDVSPILAFLLLGMLGQLARPPRPF